MYVRRGVLVLHAHSRPRIRTTSPSFSIRLGQDGGEPRVPVYCPSTTNRAGFHLRPHLARDQQCRMSLHDGRLAPQPPQGRILLTLF